MPSVIRLPGKNTSFRCTTAEFTPPTLDHESFAASCLLAAIGIDRLAIPFFPSTHTFAVRLLPRSVILTRLRLTSLAVVSSREDFQLSKNAPMPGAPTCDGMEYHQP
jgi:hypothetical protein